MLNPEPSSAGRVCDMLVLRGTVLRQEDREEGESEYCLVVTDSL